MRRTRSIFLAVVSLLVIATMVLAATGPNPGSGSTDIRVMNTSDQQASVTVDYYNPAGGIESTKSATLPPNGSTDFLAADSGLSDGFNGSAVVSSDQELASVAFIHWVGGEGGDGFTAGAYSGVPLGSTELFCPSLAARPNKQKSVLAVQNADSGTADVELFFYDRDGNAWSGNPLTASLPEGAGQVWDLTDFLGDDPDEILDPPGDGWLGSVKVSSPNGKKLAAVVTMFWGGANARSAAYNCASSGSNVIYFPDIKRRVGADPSVGWKQYGGNVIQNLSSTSVANIQVDLLDRDGTVLYTFNHTINPLASQGFNTRFPANAPDPDAFFSAMGDDFNGALRITSDQPLAAVYNSTTLTGGNPRASTYTAEGGDVASTDIYFPAVYRLVVNGTFTRYSALLVYNPGNTPANVTITVYAPDGTQVKQFTDQIPGGTSHGYNTRWGVSMPNPEELGDAFMGSIHVSSDVPVVGLSNVNYPDQQATYNAYKK